MLADWMVAGEPRECQLIELGPGRGTLLKDMMRVRAIVYEVSSMLSISLSLVSGFCVMLNVAEEHNKRKNDELPWMGFKPAHSRVLLWHCTCTCIYIIRSLCAGVWPVQQHSGGSLCASGGGQPCHEPHTACSTDWYDTEHNLSATLFYTVLNLCLVGDHTLL